jgi:Phosphohydrolase-associated domain
VSSIRARLRCRKRTVASILTIGHWRQYPEFVQEELLAIPNGRFLRILLGQLIVKNHVEKGLVDVDAAVVVDKAELAKTIHEEADPGSGRSNHVGKGLLRDLWNFHQRFACPPEFRHQQEDSCQTLFAGIEQLIDKVSLSSHTAFKNKGYERERELFLEAALKRHPEGKGFWADPNALRESFNEIMIGLFPLSDRYSGKWKERAKLREFTSQLIGQYIGGTTLRNRDGICELHINDHIQLEVAMLKELTWIYVIEAPSLVSQQFGQRQAIRKFFEIYFDASRHEKRHSLFPPYYREAIGSAEAGPLWGRGRNASRRARRLVLYTKPEDHAVGTYPS